METTMKRIAPCLLLLMTALSMPAHAYDSVSRHVTGSLAIHDACDDLIGCSNKQPGLRILAGTDFHWEKFFLGLEAGYSSYYVDSSRVINNTRLTDSINVYSIPIKLRLGTVRGNLSAFAKIGVHFWEYDVSAAFRGIDIKVEGTDPLLGIGAAWQFLKRENYAVSARADLDYYFVDDSDLQQADVIRTFAAGVQVSF